MSKVTEKNMPAFVSFLVYRGSGLGQPLTQGFLITQAQINSERYRERRYSALILQN